MKSPILRDNGSTVYIGEMERTVKENERALVDPLKNS